MLSKQLHIPRLPSFIFLITILLFSACNNNRSGSGQRTAGPSPSPEEAHPVQQVQQAAAKADYNIYIENSGSMFGYVTRPTHFSNSVYSMITDLYAKGVANKLNLFFINDSICPQKPDADPKDIQLFIKNLGPQTLEGSGCGVRNSQLPDIIKQVISAAPDKINILISDCIFSDNGGNSSGSLDAAKNSLELFVSRELSKRAFSTIVIKLSSPYYGKYWIETASRTKKWEVLSGQSRPYYMLVFGRQDKLALFNERIRFKDYEGYENTFSLLPPAASRPPAQIIRNNKIGDFRIEQPATRLVINNAAPDGRSGTGDEFQFCVAADLQRLSMEESYFSDPSNYELPSNYTLASVSKTDPLNNESQSGYSHVFALKTTDLKQNQEVFIKLKSKLPGWVSRTSTTDDGNPFDATQQKQTFGLKYLIDGMAEAYADKWEGKEQFNITVQVSRDRYAAHGTGSNFPWWIILVLVALVAIIIWLKNKK